MSDLQAALRAAAERIAGAGETTEDVVQAFLQVQSQDLSRLTPAQWFGRFAYVISSDGFFDLVTRRFIHRKTFDALFRHVKTNSVHDGKPCRPSIAFDESRHAMNGLTAHGTTYAPGMGPLCARQGSADCNIWLDGRQVGIADDCTPWLKHLQTIFPNEPMREHVLNVLAHKLQRPSIKINSGILLAGCPGCGKDSLFAPFLWALGGSELRNIAVTRNEDVVSAFNYSVESELMVINELRMTSTSESRALENFLKPVLAAPPELIPVNKKQEHPYLVLNRTLVIAFSNEKRPIVLPADDRRWFVHWTDAPRMSESDAKALWSWYAGRGNPAVAALLAERDISGFNPAAPPMMTPAKAFLLRAPEHDTDGMLLDLAARQAGPFQSGLVAAPWINLCRALEREFSERGAQVTVAPAALLRALRESGWTDRGRVAAHGHGRRAVWVHPAAPVARLTDSELRRQSEVQWPQDGAPLHLVAG